MTIFTQGARRRNVRYLDEFQAPLGQTLSAQAREAWIRSPLSSLGRSMELTGAEDPAIFTNQERERLREAGVELPTNDQPQSTMVDAQSARERVNELELDLEIPDEGIQEEALNILVDRKQEERRIQDVLNRAPQGVGASVLRFGTSVAASMTDPLNVASAFVPWFGPARYARQLQQATTALGRAGVRARFGALEGAAGAAAVEPIVLGAARQEQADYTVTDSIANIAIGTALGGGLHMGAGAAADALRRGRTPMQAEPQGPTAERVASYSPETRRNVFTSALAQELTGRATNVDAMLRFVDGVESVQPSTMASARRQTTDDWTRDMRTALETEAESRMNRGTRREVEQELQSVEYELGRASGDFRARVRQLQRDEALPRRQAERRVQQSDEQQRAQLEERRTALQEQLKQDDVARAARSDLSRLEQGIVPERFRDRVEQEAQSRLDAARSGSAQTAVGRAMRSRPDLDLSGRWNALRAAANENQQPTAMRGHDPELAARLREELDTQMRRPETPEEAQNQANEVLTELQELQSRLGDDVIDQAEVERLDAEIRSAGDYRRGLEALGACQMRRA